jgi:hypothetical protein
MPSFRLGAPSKLILEQDDMIYECIEPNISLTMAHDCLTIEARCWNFTTRLKETEENMDILDNLEQEVKVEKKAKKKVKARKDRFPKDGGRPIKASVPGYSKIPWTKATLTLIAQSPDGQIHYAKTIEEKKQFAWGNFKWILVCWPGQYSQDIFLIDDMSAFRYALGFKKRSEAVVTDEQGEEWLYEMLFAPKTNKPPVVPKSYNSPLDYRYDGRF